MGAKHIGEALKTNKTLTTLDLPCEHCLALFVSMHLFLFNDSQ